MIDFNKFISKIFNYDLINYYTNYYKNNKLQINTYFLSFLFIIIAFGSKLSFQSYPADDYARMISTEKWFEQADKGRWFTSILNHFIFNQNLFISPYFNTLISLFFISFSGFVISKICVIKNQFKVFFIILIITISPFWADNLFYNSNVTVSIGVFLSTIGVYFFIKKKRILISLCFLILSYGVYQTTFQYSILIVGSWYLLKILNVENLNNLKNLGIDLLLIFLFIIISYLTSFFINELIIKNNSIINIFSPYNTVTRKLNLLIVINKFFYLFSSPKAFIKHLTLYNTSFGITTFMIFITGLFAFLYDSIKSKKMMRYKIIIFIILLFFLAIILQLPRILTVLMPIRASFHFSILLILFLILATQSRIKLIKSLGVILSITYLTLSFQYISSFYDISTRQTQADILRANMIVNRIRMDENFEKLKTNMPNFIILGEKYFAVPSKYSKQYDSSTIDWKNHNPPPLYYEEQAFNRSWSKYKIFENFTDFRFKQLNNDEIKNIIHSLPDKKNINAYPEAGSILFLENTIILILDKNLVK